MKHRSHKATAVEGAEFFLDTDREGNVAIKVTVDGSTHEIGFFFESLDHKIQFAPRQVDERYFVRDGEGAIKVY